ncbi:Uncharacterised protein [Klebsiella pneumoniae]|uniref:Uncharacterized protein n=1 Tax=Klebsiella pneumoniae TaxID=573 RepID=A0A4P0Y8T7_KLEPN|nr:Uncharacterised protein [Klebsiella pneumoniae]
MALIATFNALSELTVVSSAPNTDTPCENLALSVICQAQVPEA